MLHNFEIFKPENFYKIWEWNFFKLAEVDKIAMATSHSSYFIP